MSDSALPGPRPRPGPFILPRVIMIHITTFLFNVDDQIIKDYKKYVTGLYVRSIDFKIDKAVFENIRYLKFKMMNQAEMRLICSLEVQRQRYQFMINIGRNFYPKLLYVDFANDTYAYNHFGCRISHGYCGAHGDKHFDKIIKAKIKRKALENAENRRRSLKNEN